MSNKRCLDLDDLREQLAAIEHERWADWQRHVHALAERRSDGSLVLPADRVAVWERQINASYTELSEPEKAADRREVGRYWPLLAPLLTEVRDLRLSQTALTAALNESGRYGEWARAEIVRLQEEVRQLRNPTSNDSAITWQQLEAES